MACFFFLRCCLMIVLPIVRFVFFLCLIFMDFNFETYKSACYWPTPTSAFLCGLACRVFCDWTVTHTTITCSNFFERSRTSVEIQKKTHF